MTSEVAAAEHPRRRRTVMVSSAVLALAAIIFALLYATRGDQVEVPDVRRLTSVEAAAKLAQSGLKVKTHDVDAAGFKAGVVVTQSPDPGSDVDKNSVVDLGVATGFVAIPKGLIGKSYEDAARLLDKVGLKAQRNDQPSDQTAGTVTAVDPSDRAEPGDTVVLTVASRSGGPSDTSNDKKEKKGKGKEPKDPTTEPTATTPTEPTATTPTEPPPAD